ncbi:NAD-dependent epimerase/dehydratase family protein [Modestobacter excelsi]|uniref:NAD-dependent epimerase/dehydratase family protein n=1 Tax=Modestobacter excelsi TaxID=2213161 RepID=UPI00110CB33C|nr:NAD(P)-dependent oxidoreductase [Modestobacter excelsi]
MANVLVTGGTGLIGWATTERLAQDGHRVVVYDKSPDLDNLATVRDDVAVVQGDITDVNSLLRTAKSHHVDHIVHLAAFIAHEGAGLPAESIHVNVRGLANVFDIALALDVRRVVWTSSIAAMNVGPDYDGTPVDESFVAAPVTPYGISKYACEAVAAVYNRARGLSSVGLRPQMAYGFGRLTGRVGEFNAAVRQIALGLPATADFDMGSQPVQPIYNRDYGRLISSALFTSTSLSSHIYNTPVERNYTWSEIADEIRDLVPDADFTLGPRPAAYARTPVTDGALAARELGFTPQYTLRDGLTEMIRHYRGAGR